jgi:hypothetical protein
MDVDVLRQPSLFFYSFATKIIKWEEEREDKNIMRERERFVKSCKLFIVVQISFLFSKRYFS